MDHIIPKTPPTSDPEDIPQEALGFTPSDTKSPLTEKGNLLVIRQSNNELTNRFQKAQLADLEAQKILRWVTAGFIGAFLLVQNSAIFYFVYISLKETANLVELQGFYAVLIAGTLTETYKLTELMMKWLYKDRPYKPDHQI